jgi:hypothetical protein
MGSFKIAHHSSNNAQANIKDGANKTVSQGAQIITWSEFIQNDRANTLKDWAADHGWGFYQYNEKPYDNCAITWNKDNWTKIDVARKILSDVTWKDKEGNTKPKFAAIAVFLERSNGERWIVVALHAPPSSCTRNGWEGNDRSKAMKDGMKGLKNWLADLNAKWNQNGVVVSGDWNLYIEEKWCRNFLNDTVDGYRVMGNNEKGQGYPDTHASATYDWFMFGNNVKATGDSKAVPMPDSDHHTIIAPVALK